MALNQNNVSKWGDMSISGLLFQWAIKIQLTCFSSTKPTSPHHRLIENELVHAMIYELALNNNQSFTLIGDIYVSIDDRHM